MIGNTLLVTALFASLFSVYMYYLSYKGLGNTLKLARIGFHVTAVAVIIASAFLLHAILTHQYEYKYVYNYSGSGMPGGLLISTFYAGQEGSFMLWALFTAIVGLVLLEYTSKRGELEPRVMMVFTFALSFLLIMVNPLLKSPFNYIWTDPSFIDIKNLNPSYLSMPFIQSFIFSDSSSNTNFIKMGPDLYSTLAAQGISINNFILQGKGLNPLLQNFWMQIHPPMLFVGFSMSTVPFAFALAALLKNEYKDWIKQSLPWILSASMILGLAIMLGGYWAYGVLGWGGYWGWDPVENSSLVPWIISVALIHTMLIQRKTQSDDKPGRFGKTNIILAILTYLLVLYSTFLTRSGILGDASVHSFVSPGKTVYLFLVLFISSFTLIGVGGLIYRWKELTKYFEFEEDLLSRELALFTGAVTLIASAIIVIAGTSAPIFGSAVEIRFYNELNLPIAIIMGVLNGLSLLLKWKTTPTGDLINKSKFAIASSLIVAAIVIIVGGLSDIMLMLFALSASFTMVVNAEIAFRIVKGKKSFLGAYIAHIGIALFFLGVIASGGYSDNKQIDLVKGETKSLYGYDVTFTGFVPFEDGKKYAFNIDVNDGGNISTVSPVMYIAEFNNSLMREPDILSMLTEDFYISPVGYDEGNAATTAHEHSFRLEKNSSQDVDGHKITFVSFNFPPDAMAAMQEGKDFFIGARLFVESNGQQFQVEPRLQNSGGKREYVGVEIPELNLKIDLSNLDASGTVDLVTSPLDEQKETVADDKPKQEILSIEASIKPFISLVWLGVIVMVIGYIFAAFRRTKESQT